MEETITDEPYLGEFLAGKDLFGTSIAHDTSDRVIGRYILAMPPPRPLQIDSKTLMRQPLNCQTRQPEDVNPP